MENDQTNKVHVERYGKKDRKICVPFIMNMKIKIHEEAHE